jgi:hypothetical protein
VETPELDIDRRTPHFQSNQKPLFFMGPLVENGEEDIQVRARGSAFAKSCGENRDGMTND